MGEYSNNGTVIKEFVYLAELPIAVLTPVANYYIYADQLNTPRAVTNISNTVIWQWLGDPFGTTLADTDPDNDGVNFNFNLRFAGQYYDAESGLHYNYFRDYNPSTGRYIEPDPIGLNGGINLYGYVEGNPVNHFDSRGLESNAYGGESPSYYFPSPFDVFIPGTPANNSFVDSTYQACKSASDAFNQADTDKDPSTPTGRRGSPIDVPKGTNAPTTIGGRDYSGHALDQMQGRGVPPSAVEDAIKNGIKSPDPIPGRTRNYSPENNITIITEGDKVVTVITGKR